MHQGKKHGRTAGEVPLAQHDDRIHHQHAQALFLAAPRLKLCGKFGAGILTHIPTVLERHIFVNGFTGLAAQRRHAAHMHQLLHAGMKHGINYQARRIAVDAHHGFGVFRMERHHGRAMEHPLATRHGLLEKQPVVQAAFHPFESGIIGT